MDEIAESKFNEGLAKLNRIGYQRSLLMSFRPKHQYGRIFECLCNIRTEIWERMNEVEQKKCKKYEADLRIDMVVSYRKGINILLLEKYEEYLQELAYRYKLSMPDRDKASAALR